MNPPATTKQAGPLPRSVSRLAAVQALYQMDMAEADLNVVIDEFVKKRSPVGEPGETVARIDPTFFAEIIRGVVRRQRDIDPLVDETLASGWRLVRVDAILRAILRAATFELMERPDVPARVVINEYINVAHAFFVEDEPRVVNGVLDRIGKHLRMGELTSKPAAESDSDPGPGGADPTE